MAPFVCRGHELQILRVLSACALIAGLALGGCGNPARSWPHKEFSAEQWRLTAPEQRYFFFNSLVGSSHLDNLSRELVVELLGPPDSEAPDGRYVTYVIKYVTEEEWTFDSVYLLHIEFDKQGRGVARYYLRSD